MISKETETAVMDFVHERDWNQFHTPANLAKSICIEKLPSSWNAINGGGGGDDPRDGNEGHVTDELADVLTNCIQLADRLDLDMDRIIMYKLQRTADRYLVATSHGSSRQYRALQ
ncbi:MazG-like family protein [Bifidobacterium sp. B4107]|uniref:MazG-like family protein n=1 Tax=Bifidobacterium sp. B4107 TaxID=2817966 RepID=UPI00226B02D7|nr:MazG-like family protein [Bifidobacterium sp. B4107]